MKLHHIVEAQRVPSEQEMNELRAFKKSMRKWLEQNPDLPRREALKWAAANHGEEWSNIATNLWAKAYEDRKSKRTV